MISSPGTLLKAGFMFCAVLLAATLPVQAADPVLSVDLSRERQQISPYIYGVNIASWCPTYYLDLCAPYLRDARVEVVRLGAINMERYNWRTNRTFNVISQRNEYRPLSWESFIRWCRFQVGAEPFLQVSVFGNVAGEADTPDSAAYNHVQTNEEVAQWIRAAGPRVRFWGVGNEPFIAWKRLDYPVIYSDAAHGDQVLNSDTAYDVFFPRFFSLANIIKSANPRAQVFGPTPANWWMYWTNDYSPLCPVIAPGAPALPEDPAWQTMYAPENIWNTDVFPDRGGDPDITGWETDQQRILPQYLLRAEDAEARYGRRVADYLDVHRYIQATSDFMAIQEPRGLWENDFKSFDLETLAMGVETRILKRFQTMVDAGYPGTKLSFTEYDFFYWQGYPSIPQIAAVAQMDFLGYFARAGVQLACNWYVGEPNQSGEGLRESADSARQAMFNEQGEPNPKYWAFWLMSRYFRGTSVFAEPGDSELFSVHACVNGPDTVVAAAFKGRYDAQGAFIPQQGPETARITIANKQGQPGDLTLRALYRFGMHDPRPVRIESPALRLENGTVTHSFEPLALYLFIFSSCGRQQDPEPVLITPERIDFGPYETGVTLQDGVPQPTTGVAVTSTRASGTVWSVSTHAPWLSIQGSSTGTARVTDMIYLLADRSGLAAGTHETRLTVTTPDTTVHIPVTIEVVPGEEQGVRRICDFETGSLAHVFNIEPPYSIGWWDGHGGVEDRNRPYIYRMRIDRDNHAAGSTASLRVDFARFLGDTDAGRRFLSFGTYGHANATADWSGFDSFAFDIQTRTIGKRSTGLQIVITDEAGNKGKPDLVGASWRDRISLRDGHWQTVTIPIGPGSRFYDWRYPEAQDGTLTEIDFSRIAQIEFGPELGSRMAVGRLNIDNLRLIRQPDAEPAGQHTP